MDGTSSRKRDGWDGLIATFRLPQSAEFLPVLLYPGTLFPLLTEFLYWQSVPTYHFNFFSVFLGV